MKSPFALTLLLLLALIPAISVAKPKKPTPSGDHKITEVSGASITISVGSSGDQHETYRITKDTRVSINGVDSDAGDLRAGMTAKVSTGSDPTVASSISAQDPKKNPKPHRVG